MEIFDADYVPEEDLPPDPKTIEAKETLMRDLFDQWPKEVFYARQISVLFERKFFHWITARALNELVEEGRISSQEAKLTESTSIRFFWSRGNRYWARKAARISALVREFFVERTWTGRARGNDDRRWLGWWRIRPYRQGRSDAWRAELD